MPWTRHLNNMLTVFVEDTLSEFLSEEKLKELLSKERRPSTSLWQPRVDRWKQ